MPRTMHRPAGQMSVPPCDATFHVSHRPRLSRIAVSSHEPLPAIQPFDPDCASHARAHDVATLMALFDGLFGDTFNTLLRLDPEEPLYLPAGRQGEGKAVTHSELSYHRIYLARGFFSSALHEVSHWCIAGAERRLKEDYGYWYAPDGRDAEQQRAFESVEVAPQALELLFHRAVGKPFHVSVDNLELEVDREAFTRRVLQRAADVEQRGLTARAAAFRQALVGVWQQGATLEQAIAAARPLLPAVGEDGRLA